jgi:CBS domain-containing protein
VHVADLMKTDLKTVLYTQTVGEALAILADNHISGLPVIDPHEKLLGVVTAADILEGLAESPDPEARDTLLDETLVREVMTPLPRTIGPDATVRDAAQQMLYLEVHRLFVEEHGRLVGVISTMDLVRGLATANV